MWCAIASDLKVCEVECRDECELQYSQNKIEIAGECEMWFNLVIYTIILFYPHTKAQGYTSNYLPYVKSVQTQYTVLPKSATNLAMQSEVIGNNQLRWYRLWQTTSPPQ